MLTFPENSFTLSAKDVLKTPQAECKAAFPMINTYPHGMPLGGLGAGTVRCNPYGWFDQWHLFPGIHLVEALPACQFVVSQRPLGTNTVKTTRLSVDPENSPRELSQWKTLFEPGEVSWSSLYPRTQFDFKNSQLPVSMQCIQFSPIWAHNYQESSYPVGNFVWQLHNQSDQEVVVTLCFSFENIAGWSYQKGPESEGPVYHWQKQADVVQQSEMIETSDALAVLMSAPGTQHWSESICIAVQKSMGATVSAKKYFDPTGSGESLWSELESEGVLRNDPLDKPRQRQASAVAVRVVLSPYQKTEIPFALSWDFKTGLRSERFFKRFYPQHSALRLAQAALKNYQDWYQKVESFQAPYLLSKKLPDWFKPALLNELYYLADGGSLWDAHTGSFVYLECFDYYFYETLDVRYYGSWPLALLWPEIEKQTMLDFAHTISAENPTFVQYNLGTEMEAMSGHTSSETANHLANQDPIKMGPRKIAGAAPHDLGSPFEKPWQKINAYLYQNSNRWKDLNSKFVLQVYRSYYLRGYCDDDFLKKCWPAVQASLEYLQTLDTDQDGLPENENFPDQTFDNWKMAGSSAYCGILALAAWSAAIRMAERLGLTEWVVTARQTLSQAKKSLIQKLWNGRYFHFDEKTPDIMAAQLMGQWYLDLLNLRSLFEPHMIQSVFQQIYEFNFMDFKQGRLGAVNGRTPERGPVEASQGNDVWTGVNYALASHWLFHGQKRKAWKLIRAVVEHTYQKGFFFRTPESWDEQENFIASMYMRPGAIWAIPYVLGLRD